MAYHRRKSGIRLMPLIILGVMGGIIFLIYDNFPSIMNTFRGDALATEQPDSIQLTAEPPEGSQPLTISETNNSGNTDAITDFQPDIPAGTSLFIPSAGIYADIFRVYLDGESWDVSKLGTNVGHLQGTSWLSEHGNVVLSGHVELADGRKGAFATLNEVKVGDLIIVKQGDEEFRYSVTEIAETTPDDLKPLYPSVSNKLTLITCGNYDFFSDSYLHRVVIVAVPLTF